MSSATKRTPEAEEKQPAALASVVRWMWRKASVVRWMWRLAGDHILLLLAVYGPAAFVIYLVLVTVGPLDGLRLSTQLALGQVIIGWVALSLAIPGGYVAIHEFRAATARPDMHLQFPMGLREWKPTIPKPSEGDVTQSVEVVNRRDEVVAQSWQVLLIIPEELGGGAKVVKKGSFDGNWDGIGNGKWRFSAERNDFVLGPLPAVLGNIEFGAGASSGGPYTVEYTVFTDRGPSGGQLQIEPKASA